MKLSDILGGKTVDFTLPSLGAVTPDDGCTCKVDGFGCKGESACTNSAGSSCDEGKNTCSKDACSSDAGSGTTCGSGTCTTKRDG